MASVSETLLWNFLLKALSLHRIKHYDEYPDETKVSLASLHILYFHIRPPVCTASFSLHWYFSTVSHTISGFAGGAQHKVALVVRGEACRVRRETSGGMKGAEGCGNGTLWVPNCAPPLLFLAMISSQSPSVRVPQQPLSDPPTPR